MQLMVRTSSAAGGRLHLWGTGRRVRTLVASIVTVALAVGAHVIGEGMAPSAAVLLPVVAAVWVAAYWLAQRQIRSWHWLLLLGGTQAAVHALSSIVGMSHQHVAVVDPVTMTVAHTASTVITAAVLAFGERVWWLILSWIRRIVVAVFRPSPLEGSSGWAIVTHDVPIRARARAGVVGMRAPPSAAV